LNSYDVLIIGSGLAGMSAALHLAQSCKVALVTKHELLDGASSWAQGGIAAVMESSDSVEDHIRDTHVAGAGLCHDDAVDWLVAQGVPFTRDDANQDELHLTREGGHSHRRIVHAADATGSAVQKTLVGQVKSHRNIDVLEWHIAIDLITSRKLDDTRGPNRVWGAYALDIKGGGVKTIGARHTVLASGGAGKVYLYTTNPDIATGDGVAMGWRAGASVANMEFIQFHPTCLFHPHAKSFLISEAVRGEGGLLRLPDGERFMPRHDPRAELAPRDIVARAIDFEIKKHGIDCVFLDITHKGPDFIRAHFPTIYARCLEFGIDITKDAIPVVPAAHYTCGGLVTDLHGRTPVNGLYALGEVASTGLHGANRLASNSLL
jgi:L-aspartate oxidase